MPSKNMAVLVRRLKIEKLCIIIDFHPINALFYDVTEVCKWMETFNPSPAEPGYTLPLQTV